MSTKVAVLALSLGICLGACSGGVDPPSEQQEQVALQVGDCLAGGSPKGDYGEYYLLPELTPVPCSDPHHHEIYAPGYTVGGVTSQKDAGEDCPSPRDYTGWTNQPLWQHRLAGMTIVSALQSTGAPVQVYCSYAVVEFPPGGQPAAVETEGTLRNVASRGNAAISAYGACMSSVPEVGQGIVIGACKSGQGMWLKGRVPLDSLGDAYPGEDKIAQPSRARCVSHARAITGTSDQRSFALRIPSAQAWSGGWLEAGCHIWYDAIRAPTPA